MPLHHRNHLWQSACTQHFDVCIIGGGATGAGCALDAASRGLRTLLIEGEDFGAATSGKSTKLIHGGVRYLEQAVKQLNLAQYRMVRKALQERTTLLRIAPHLTRSLPLVTPCRSLVQSLYYFLGMKLYDWISGKSSLGRSQLLTRSQALARIPNLRRSHLRGAVLYYDGQMDDLRLNLALVQTAMEQGAVCINHARATGFGHHPSGGVDRLMVQDTLTGATGTVRASCFVNATGPFADAIRQMANAAMRPRIRVSRGVHLLLPKHVMPGDAALLIPETRDGRLIFAIPYQHHLLVGTTDEETALTASEFGPNGREVTYLLEHLKAYLDTDTYPSDICAGFGGLRPLIEAAGNTRDLVRDHEVETDPVSGLVSILGGKWTTYRLMARDTLDVVEQRLGRSKGCATQNITLVGSHHWHAGLAESLQRQTGWESAITLHLAEKYGDRAMQIAAVADLHPELRARVHEGMPFTLAELQYVVEHEMAYTLPDIIGRRWGIALANWAQAIRLMEPVARFVAPLLGWSAARAQAEVAAYRAQVQQQMNGIQT